MPDFDYYDWTRDQHYYYWITRITTCRTKDTNFGQEIYITRHNNKKCYMPDYCYYFWTRTIHYKTRLQDFLYAGL